MDDVFAPVLDPADREPIKEHLQDGVESVLQEFNPSKWTSDEDEGEASLLGMGWTGQPEDQKIPMLKGKNDADYDSYTRKELAGVTHSLYDPLSLALPLLVHIRLVETALNKTAWNEKVPEEIVTKMKDWTRSCKLMPLIPRLLPANEVLLVFADASGVASSSVAYVGKTIAAARGHVWSHSEKLFTTPRKELIAAESGAKLIERFAATFKPKQTILATDSQICYYRILFAETSKLKPFEARRIERLRRIITKYEIQMRYVPTHLNPADIACRGLCDRENLREWVTPAILHDQHYLPLIAGEDLPPTGKVALVKQTKGGIAWEVEKGDSVELALLDDNPNDKTTSADDKVRSLFNPLAMVRLLIEVFCAWRKCNHEGETTAEGEVDLVFVALNRAQLNDNTMVKFRTFLEQGNKPDETTGADMLKQTKEFDLAKNGLLVRKWAHDPNGVIKEQVVVPTTARGLQRWITRSYHVTLGHVAGTKVSHAIKQSFWWKKMGRTVNDYCRSCQTCQRYRGHREWRSEAGNVTVKPVPGSVVGIDILEPGTMTSGNRRFVLSITCFFTKYTSLYSLLNSTALAIIAAMERYTLTVNVPDLIWSDNGKQFISIAFANYAKSLGAVTRRIPPNAPFRGGWYERIHGEVNPALATLQSERHEEWDVILARVEYALNVRPLDESGVSPWLLFKGYDPKLLGAPGLRPDTSTICQLLEENAEVQRARQYLQVNNSLRNQLHHRAVVQFVRLWEKLRHQTKTRISERARYVTEFQVGDLALVWRQTRGKPGQTLPPWQTLPPLARPLSDHRVRLRQSVSYPTTNFSQRLRVGLGRRPFLAQPQRIRGKIRILRNKACFLGGSSTRRISRRRETVLKGDSRQRVNDEHSHDPRQRL